MANVFDGLSVGDTVKVIGRPTGDGPEMGAICKVLSLGLDTVKITFGGNHQGWFIKMRENVVLAYPDMELDVGL